MVFARIIPCVKLHTEYSVRRWVMASIFLEVVIVWFLCLVLLAPARRKLYLPRILAEPKVVVVDKCKGYSLRDPSKDPEEGVVIITHLPG